MDNNAWRDIPGCEGWYQASNGGKIRRIAPVRRNSKPVPHVLADRFDRKGYCHVVLYKGKEPRNLLVHRLVALAFIGPAPDGSQVNHKNGNKADNRPENIEYVTPSENTLHRFRVLGKGAPFGENHHRAKLTERDVRKIRQLGEDGLTVTEIKKQFPVAWETIKKILTRKAWKWLE